MKVLVSGGSGMLGTALRQDLLAEGHTVVQLKRPGSRHVAAGDPVWEPKTGRIDPEALEGLDAVVHLSGAGLADRRWSPERKAVLRSSRVDTTRLLAEALAALRQPPRVLVCASAVGIYGDRGDESLDETSPAGDDFLARLGQEWEAAAAGAVEAGIRTVHLRSGVVLTPHGGALQRMLLPFRLGLGGKLGDGRQRLSWIHLDDTIAIIRFAMDNEGLNGPVNSTSPQPVSNAEFTETLARVLGRPAFLRIPKWLLRLIFGEMAEATLLTSTRAVPSALLRAGYSFRHPRLEDALRAVLDRPRRP